MEHEGIKLNSALIPVKNTFVHFNAPDAITTNRSNSAPPDVRYSGIVPPRKRKTRRARRKPRPAKTDDDIIAEFRMRARTELWSEFARTKILMHQVIAWRWNRMRRTLLQRDSEPIRRAAITERVFRYVIAYSMRSSLELLWLFTATILRSKHGAIEIWADKYIVHATKITKMIKNSKYFVGLAQKGLIMLRLPDRQEYFLQWKPNFPILALQGKVFYACGLSPEDQQLQCLGQIIQTDDGVLGNSCVVAGDVIDVLDKSQFRH